MLKLRLLKLRFAVVFLSGYLRRGTTLPFGLPFAFDGSFGHPFTSTAIAVLFGKSCTAVRSMTCQSIRQSNSPEMLYTTRMLFGLLNTIGAPHRSNWASQDDQELSAVLNLMAMPSIFVNEKGCWRNDGLDWAWRFDSKISLEASEVSRFQAIKQPISEPSRGSLYTIHAPEGRESIPTSRYQIAIPPWLECVIL